MKNQAHNRYIFCNDFFEKKIEEKRRGALHFTTPSVSIEFSKFSIFANNFDETTT
jgi:hypothetical protein